MICADGLVRMNACVWQCFWDGGAREGGPGATTGTGHPGGLYVRLDERHHAPQARVGIVGGRTGGGSNSGRLGFEPALRRKNSFFLKNPVLKTVGLCMGETFSIECMTEGGP